METNYQVKAAAYFGRLGTQAIERLVAQDCRDLFQSLDEAEVVSAIIGFERLHMDSLENPATVEDVLGVHKRTLGYLLFTKKVAVASYGLSSAGKVQFDALVALVHKPAPAEDPVVAEYQEFNKRADTVEYQTRILADEGFRTWANSTK